MRFQEGPPEHENAAKRENGGEQTENGRKKINFLSGERMENT